MRGWLRLRTGFTLHNAGDGTYHGFTIDGDHRYLLGDFTVTHNSGKTIMLSAAVGERLRGTSGKAAVLAHRDELTAQNLAKFRRVNPAISTSVVDASTKSWNGQVTFAMVPTLTRAANLDAMPALDLLVIDEAHHVIADSYRRIIDRALHRNPMCKVYGVTATPNRGDRQGLRKVFSNVADQIRLGELIASGHLVPPRTFVIDVGVQDKLTKVRRVGDDYDMAAVAEIMNQVPVTDAVIEHWQDRAEDRQTVVFCSTVAHAEAVTEAFNAAGVSAALVTGEMPEAERRHVLAAYGSGEIQVVVNVAVLTEAPSKTCPECTAEIPLACHECPLCGHAFPPAPKILGGGEFQGGMLSDFLMTEIDLLKRSSFQWCDLFGDDAALIANGFNAWGGIFCLNGRWHAIGGGKAHRTRLLAIGERMVCLAAADDWLNEHETDESAHKSKAWLRESPTERQLTYLPSAARADLSMTRYQASALLTFQFNKQAIRSLVLAANDDSRREAA